MIRRPYEKLLRAGLGCLAGFALAACSQATPPSDGVTAQAPDAPAASLPPAIARALGTDERMLDCAQGTRAGVSQFQPDWVKTQRIDLNADGRKDWIVKGLHACLREGDAPYWWAYADEAVGQRLILSAAAAQDLQPADARTNGFRDLRLRRDGGDTVAHYDGTQYALPTATEAATSPKTQVATVAGRLDIEALPRAEDGQDVFRIALAGKELRRTGGGADFPDFPVPRMLQTYPQGIAPFDETIVFQQDMRGNACNGGPLWILGLKRDGAYAISDPIDFCGGKSPQLSATRDELKIVLPGGPLNRGEGEVPTEVWKYRDGKIERVAVP